MKTHSSADLLNEYCNSIKHLYPHLTKEQIKEVAMHPWRELNRKMKSPNLPSIRIKYFGQFIVKEGRVRALDARVEAKFKRGRILERVYLEQVETYKTYLKMKYEDLLEQFGFGEEETSFINDYIRYFTKGTCTVAIQTKDNEFCVISVNSSVNKDVFWFNSYDLLKEILKKV